MAGKLFYRPSAFKHGIRKEEMLYAMINNIVETEIPGRNGLSDVTLFIGYGDERKRYYLEVIAEITSDGEIVIFHAMRLREKIRREFAHFL